MLTRRISTTFQRSARLSLGEWMYLAVAARNLLIARVQFAALPLEILLKQLTPDELPEPSNDYGDLTGSVKIDVARLKWAVAVAARYVPWRSDCMIQALAANRWLKGYRIHSDFYLGVVKLSGGKLRAHAWLKKDEITVTGGVTDEFAVLLRIGSKGRSIGTDFT